jgi:hypothetical protein
VRYGAFDVDGEEEGCGRRSADEEEGEGMKIHPNRERKQEVGRQLIAFDIPEGEGGFGGGSDLPHEPFRSIQHPHLLVQRWTGSNTGFPSN